MGSADGGFCADILKLEYGWPRAHVLVEVCPAFAVLKNPTSDDILSARTLCDGDGETVEAPSPSVSSSENSFDSTDAGSDDEPIASSDSSPESTSNVTPPTDLVVASGATRTVTELSRYVAVELLAVMLTAVVLCC